MILSFFSRMKTSSMSAPASRLGYSDFGVNRKRLEHLRKLFISESTDTRE